MIRKNTTEENSVTKSLNELMALEDQRQEEAEALEKAKRDAEKEACRRAEEEAKRKAEEKAKEEEEKRKEAERKAKYEESLRQAQAEAIKIKAQKEAEMAADKKRMEHEEKLAKIEAQKKVIPKWVWLIGVAILLIGTTAGAIQYNIAQTEKAQIRQAAQAEKLRLEEEKAQIEKQKEREAEELRIEAERKQREADEAKAELARKEALLKTKNTSQTKPQHKIRRTPRQVKRTSKGRNDDPLNGLQL